MTALKEWVGREVIGRDRAQRTLWVVGLVLAMFFTQGIPYWDDDFTSHFWKLKDLSIFQLLWQWLSPVSTQPQHWGFNERPFQWFLYKLSYLVAGQSPWFYLILKDLAYAGCGVMIYRWGVRLAPEGVAPERAQKGALAAAVFFLVTPGLVASHILLQDPAPWAECFFLAISYWAWGAIEATPLDWRGLPRLSDPAQRSWALRWLGAAFVTYLGYKVKADLKLIPAILATYVLLTRRHQWAYFAIPLLAMGLLAVPWGPGVFSKLPPFMPGSQGSEIGWMWQPASFERLMDFLWSATPYSLTDSPRASTISLAALLGPFLLIALVPFLIWRMEAIDKVPWTRMAFTSDRARLWALIWWAWVIVGVSALPAINYSFRIRYGILHMVPTSLLLAWAFTLFAGAMDRIPKWATGIAVALFVVQAGINLTRSITYRRDMGQVIVAVDQVYEHVNKNFPNETLALLPDFRPYDYWPEGAKSIRERVWLEREGTDGLVKNHQPLKTYVISWKPTLWDQLEMVEHFSGCRESTIFDRIFQCPAGTGTFLMRYIGQDPLYKEGEDLRSKGDVAGARRAHEQYLAKYPKSLAGLFVVGLEAYQLKDYAASQQAFGKLERYFPDHHSILYNHALTLVEMKQYKPAIERLEYIAAKEPKNYSVMINLYWAYIKAGSEKQAKRTIASMRQNFPADADVAKLAGQ